MVPCVFFLILLFDRPLVEHYGPECSQNQTDEFVHILSKVDETIDRLIINTWQYAVFTGFFLIINYSHCQCKIMRE